MREEMIKGILKFLLPEKVKKVKDEFKEMNIKEMMSELRKKESEVRSKDGERAEISKCVRESLKIRTYKLNVDILKLLTDFEEDSGHAICEIKLGEWDKGEGQRIKYEIDAVPYLIPQ